MGSLRLEYWWSPRESLREFCAENRATNDFLKWLIVTSSTLVPFCMHSSLFLTLLPPLSLTVTVLTVKRRTRCPGYSVCRSSRLDEQPNGAQNDTFLGPSGKLGICGSCNDWHEQARRHDQRENDWRHVRLQRFVYEVCVDGSAEKLFAVCVPC